MEKVERSRANQFIIFAQSPLPTKPLESATFKTGYGLFKTPDGCAFMKKRVRASPLESPPSDYKNVGADVEALQIERERLLQAIERIRNEKHRLQKETTVLFAKVKSLNGILAKSHPEPEYLKREE